MASAARALEARGRYVIMGDADGSYDFSRLDAFVERLREGKVITTPLGLTTGDN